MAKQTYTALEPIEHNKKPVPVGGSLTLDDDEAAPLLAVKAVEPQAVEEKPAGKK